MVEVVAALVEDGKRFMIAKRPMNKARGGLWEFVGGKVEPGETGEAALIRECREEMGMTVSPRSIFMDVTHEYPDITIHLTVYRAVIVQGEPRCLEHEDIRFITAEEAPQYTFCPADRDIVARVCAEKDA